MNHSTIDGFVNAAREYCELAEQDNNVTASDLGTVRELLLRLIYHIPAIEKAPHSAEFDGLGPDDSNYLRIAKRFSGFSFNFYSVIFDPHAITPPDEPVMCMLSDDLADIYRDLAQGLDNANKGHLAEACFDWSHSYKYHWARHAVNALMAIEIRRTDNNDEVEYNSDV
ncbi:MAG: DUF5063 domain-containing protein [Verrucomicrobiota bacterium]